MDTHGITTEMSNVTDGEPIPMKAEELLESVQFKRRGYLDGVIGGR